jgi:hypothetical protein
VRTGWKPVPQDQTRPTGPRIRRFSEASLTATDL